jgi:hypothetical protein
VGRTQRQHLRLTAKQVKKEKRPGLDCDDAELNLLAGSKPGVFHYRVDARVRDIARGAAGSEAQGTIAGSIRHR